MVANLLGGSSLFCGAEGAIFSGSACGVDTATGAGVSEVTGSFSGCGMDTAGGLKVGKGSRITGCRRGEVGITGTGEVWEEMGASVDAGVGKDSGDGVGLVAMLVSGCC